MSNTLRQASLDQRTKERNSTQLLEKILLSSSSSSSRQKNIIMTTQEIASTQGGQTQRTNNQGFNMTGRNWRKLVTPAHDSFKKIQQQVTTTEQSYGFNNGSKFNNEKVYIGVTTNSNNTSMDTGSMHYSVKEFTPSYDIAQMKRTMRGGDQDSNQQSQNFNESKQTRNLQEESKMKKSSLENLASASSQMKSLIKSLSNGNFQFYDQLHKKYFDRAKESQKNKPPTASQINLDRSTGGAIAQDKDFLTLTSNTNTAFGLSQLNYTNSQNNILHMKSSMESLDQNTQSAMRASSLNTRSNMISKNTMSINFKNSLYKKINPTSALLEENSQILLRDGDKFAKHQNKSTNARRNPKGRQRNISYLSSSSSSEESQDGEGYGEDQKPIDIQNHILRHQQEIFGQQQFQVREKSRSKSRQRQVNESLFSKIDKNALSRGDLSARQDELNGSSINATPKNNEVQQKNIREMFFRNGGKDQDSQNFIDMEKSQYGGGFLGNNLKEKQLFDSQNSPGVFQQLLSSANGENIQTLKENSQASSIVIHPDYLNNLQSHYKAEQSNIIFEQPHNEDNLDNTYGQETLKDRTNQVKDNQLKTEDLMSHKQTIEQQLENDSKISNNDVFKTYQEHIKMARTKINQEECSLQRSYNSQNNSLTTQKKEEGKGFVKKTVYNYQSEAPNRIKTMIGQPNRGLCELGAQNMKASNVFEDGQKSDFTFVLSNPTDFICDCNENQNNNSFMQQKPPASAFQSDFKSQQYSSYRKKPGQFKGFQNKLPEIAASPIYSEGTHNQHQCHQCGGHKGGYQSNRMSQVQHRLSYAHLNNCSIKEESHDEEEENQFNKQTITDQSYGNDTNTKQSYDSGMKNKLQQLKQNGFHFPLSQMMSSKQSSEQQEERKETKFQANQFQIQSQESEEMKRQAYEEEIRNLRNIVSFSYGYMTKLIQDNHLETQQKSEIVKMLGIISNMNSIDQSYNGDNHKLTPSTEGGKKEMSSQERTKQTSSQEFEDENLTLSQLQQQKQQMSKQNIFNYLAKNMSPSDRTKMDESYQSYQDQLTARSNAPQAQLIKDYSPILPQQKQTNKPNMKSSLISSDSHDHLKDTIYSYFEQDEVEDDYLRKSSFRASKFRENKLFQKGNNLKSSQISNKSNAIINGFKVGDLKKSLKKTKKYLIQARNDLKKEKQLNRVQEDQLKTMQAQIEALTERWKITEEKIKSGENMYQLLQKTNQMLTHTSSSNSGVMNTVRTQNQGNYFKSIQQCASSFLLQPIHNTSRSPPISIQNNSIQNTSTNFGANNCSTQNNTKSLLDINDRLTQQIENNIVLFENLNNELCEKEKEIEINQEVLKEKDQEIQKLTKKIQEMSESMKSVINGGSNSQASFSSISKQKHLEEMEQIKKKQAEYELKLQNIEFNFANSQTLFNSEQFKCSEGESGKRDRNQEGPLQRKALNCIQLSTLKKEENSPNNSQQSNQITLPLHENDFLTSKLEKDQISNKENLNQDLNIDAIICGTGSQTQNLKNRNQSSQKLNKSSKFKQSGKQSSFFNDSSDLKYSGDPSFTKTLKKTNSLKGTKK